ncbi:uncharacterized protein K02A2.6-like [Harmonia axyridis]|uniref:uncharacterized protein K02A2.6-like n=1 Tax=Harmonia axyridis TaxID=115357 RepID=UPI001E274E40|nr:uncharacterized protein K02A2.6-like [Harmonia axyridis]
MPKTQVIYRATIGSIAEYSSDDDWSLWAERLEQYFSANDIDQEKRVPVLLTLIGDKAYKTLRDLCDPALPKDKTYKELRDILTAQFSKKVSIFKERIEFYNLKQMEREAVRSWYVRIKNKASACKFRANLNEILKDKFVAGMCKSPKLDRVCEEDHTKSLAQVLEVAVNKEAALGSDYQTLHKLKTKKGQEQKSNTWKSNKNGPQHSKGEIKHGETAQKCKCCGLGNHVKKNCHLAKVCYKRQVHQVETHESNLDYAEMYHLKCDNYVASPQISLLVNENLINMELDSGASISVVPESCFNNYFKESKLKSTNIRLKCYDGTEIVPEGEFHTTINYKGQVFEFCRFLVVKKGSVPLLGRDLIKRLNIKIDLADPRYPTINSLKGKDDLKILLSRFKELFKDELGTYRHEKIELNIMPDVKPIFCKPRPVPFLFKEKINSELEKLEAKGVISKVETSEWGTPLVPVMKESGEIRLCADYKVTVNKYLIDVKHPLPRIDELFSQLHGEFFSKLDFSCAYNQLELEENTKNLLAWSTHKGIYKVNRLPFGTKPACSIFQKIVEKVLQGVNGTVIFLDDIVVTGKNREEHMKNLEEVFDKLSKAGFRLNLKKCEFFVPEVKYLGHYINKNGLHKYFDKVRAITEMPTPTDQGQVKSFVGMVGIGCVLVHVFPDGTERPISFASRKLNKAELNYSVIHKEALAIYWGVQKHYQYLLGNSFTLCSDHKPLLALFGENKGIPQMAAGCLQRWALFLSGFNYHFQYIKGSENGGADGLSRFPIESKEKGEILVDYFHFLLEDKIPISAKEIRNDTRIDNVLSKVYLFVKEGWPDNTSEELLPYKRRKLELGIEGGILLWGFRVVIPSKFRRQILEELHGAHNGMVKMKALARQYLWWPNLDADIEKYVKNCSPCMTLAKNPNKAVLTKFAEGKHVFDRIHIDFLGPIQGRNFLIIIDAYSKWPEVYEMGKMDSRSTIDMLRDCFARFGLPNIIFSDNGAQLTSSDFEEFCRFNGIKHSTSPPFHPETNGAAENSVKYFKNAIKKLLIDVREKGSSLKSMINKYLFSYRNTPHCTTGETPSKLMFGRQVKTRLDFLTKSEANLNRERQIKFHHGNREVEFEEGEEIYTKDYRDITRTKWVRAIICNKLGRRIYICTPVDNKKLRWKRHLDQLIKIGRFYDDLEIDNSDKIENVKPIIENVDSWMEEM